jgi:hypothetical protein
MSFLDHLIELHFLFSIKASEKSTCPEASKFPLPLLSQDNDQELGHGMEWPSTIEETLTLPSFPWLVKGGGIYIFKRFL